MSSFQKVPGLPSFLVDYSESEGDDDDDTVQESSAPVNVDTLVQRILFDVISTVVRRAEQKGVKYRNVGKISDGYFTEDSDDSSDSSSSSDESDTSSSSSVLVEAEKKQGQKRPPRTKGEAKPTDLPLIEDLHISVPKEECVNIGTITSIVDNLVVVKAFINTPAIDLDSVFFLDAGQRPLGVVFDVFGPVTEPYYAVRFNSSEHIREKDVSVGMEVFCAPRTKYTSFVFVDQLRKLKGSDASWKHDEEPPLKFMEFSDDEEERQAKRNHRNKRTIDESTVQPVQSDGNPFYRRNRRYNPRDFGPIQWNSMHTPPVELPHGYQLNNFMRPSALGHRFSVPPPNMTGQPLPNPFSRPPPPPMAYSNHAFRLPPPPPPPPPAL